MWGSVSTSEKGENDLQDYITGYKKEHVRGCICLVYCKILYSGKHHYIMSTPPYYTMIQKHLPFYKNLKNSIWQSEQNLRLLPLIFKKQNNLNTNSNFMLYNFILYSNFYKYKMIIQVKNSKNYLLIFVKLFTWKFIFKNLIFTSESNVSAWTLYTEGAMFEVSSAGDNISK